MSLTPAEERFIDLWGSMGVFWGINRSMARIHAYIMLAPRPVSLDELVEELAVSKGNASMSLNELRNWGVIVHQHLKGDRRDYYTAEADSWKMLFHIVKERKKREFDPALDALRDLMAESSTLDDKSGVADRMADLEKYLSLFDRLAGKFLGDEKRSRSVLSFINMFLAE